MRENNRRYYAIGLLVLLIALVLTFSPLSAHLSYASSKTSASSHHGMNASLVWTGITTNWASVRTGPGTNYASVNTFAPDTTVTVYATVSGAIVWDGISNWYRISSFSSSPLYIYGGLVVATSNGSNSGGVSASAQGKEIVISLSKQWMYVFHDGNQVYNAPVTSGRPELATPPGVYYVLAKFHPTTFFSPWSYGSPYWYAPTHINYALEWDARGFFLHDSWWRTVYGPGTNVWHHDPIYGDQTGTHGCITMPLSAAQWLYNWAPVGTMVKIQW
ncbi:MAG: L,D-transpeptidase [Chloroflexota bacterium]|nr:L,D-transpeptidase [Chloroflexota bacterium]